MDNRFTWVPLYKELAKALLRYKDNRKPLVDWIYSDLGLITRSDGKPLVNYLHQKDHSRIVDIDPFSVYGIFNRNITWNNRTEILKKFKTHLNLVSNVPTDFDGIPILDARRAFFFSWENDNDRRIKGLWEIFEKVVNNEDCEKEFNQVIDDGTARYSLTMVLFWIAPERYLALDSRNRTYLEAYGYPSEYPNLNYKEYKSLLDRVQKDMNSGKLQEKTYTDISYDAWKVSTDTPCVWMWGGDEKTMSQKTLVAGSSGFGIDYPSIKSKDEMVKAYKEIVGNSGGKLPSAYWNFIQNVKKGDYVVVFKAKKDEGKRYQELYGWGRFSSICLFDMSSKNPIQREVEWYQPNPSKPIILTNTKDDVFLHKLEGVDADRVIKLLDISADKKTQATQLKNKKYWLAGYAFGSTDSQLDRFLYEGTWEGSGSDAVNAKIEQVKAGDVLILKATGTKGTNHDQPFLRVKKLAVVLSDDYTHNGADYVFKVKYIDIPEKDFDGNTYGKYRQTIHDCDHQEIIDYVSQYLNISSMKTSKNAEYISQLVNCHNLVLTGAPGTGKTHMALEIAKEMGAETMFVQFHPSYDYTDFVEGLRPVEKNGQIGFELRDGVFKRFCKKAIKNLIDSDKSVASLTNERYWKDTLDKFIFESIEKGTKYRLINGGEFIITDYNEHAIVAYNEKNEKCSQIVINTDEILELLVQDISVNTIMDITNHFNRKVRRQPDSYTYVIYQKVKVLTNPHGEENEEKVIEKPFVCIIDEINRGEASKIFGELFYSIDPGYRVNKNELKNINSITKVQTQYQNLAPENDVFANGFFIPENVYILGTMNDIDRSVESMDFAMRRRFTWIEITPNDTESMLDNISCSAKAKATMHRLNKAIEETDGLGAAYNIGPSYFLKLNTNGGDFKKLWAMNIEPLLKEYLRGMRKSNDILEKYQKAFFNTKEETTENPELVDED